MHAVKHFVNLGAGKVMRSHIPHDQMSVSARGDDSLASVHQTGCNGSRVRDHLRAVSLELRSRNLLQLDRKRTNLVVVGTALEHGEHCEVDFVSELFFAEDDA